MSHNLCAALAEYLSKDDWNREYSDEYYKKMSNDILLFINSYINNAVKSEWDYPVEISSIILGGTDYNGTY